jgi:hypothetical protein
MQLDTGLRRTLALLVAVGLLGMSGGAWGQSPDTGRVADAIGPRTFGTSATISHTVHAYSSSPSPGAFRL